VFLDFLRACLQSKEAAMSTETLRADIEPRSGELIPLSSVPNLKWLPRRRRGAKLSYTCLWRWATKGVGGVVLQTVRVGGTPCTTETDLRHFFTDVAAAKRGESPVHIIRTSARRTHEIEAAQQRLAQSGI
jgi:hypothetical protein